MTPDLAHWRVILVRPRNPLNIGAAARALANFGFRELAVVEPYDPVWQETRSAVGAEELIHSARAVKSLAEALVGVELVIGATSGQRRNLDRELISLDRISAWIAGREPVEPVRRAALLFGSEKTGLSNQDMSYCHALVRIPTVARCPSMNLGQAVAVCCFELASSRLTFASRETSPPKTGDSPAMLSSRQHLSSPAPAESLEHLFERAVRVLDLVGYLKPQSRPASLTKLRRVLLDRGFSNHDAKVLGGVLAQIEWKLGQIGSH